MNRSVLIAFAGLAAVAAPAAQAQDATDTDSATFAVVGTVPALCSGGTIQGGGTFDFGVLVDTTTGLLRDDLSAPAQTMAGAFCSARSTITVDAIPMTAQNYLATPPAGFSRTIDFTATASNWSPTDAVFVTGAASNAAAVQQRNDAFTGDISVSVTDLATRGGDTQRPVADSEYRGTVTVTLAAAN